MNALFEGPEPLPSAPEESAGVRRTKRQQALLEAGRHPLSAVLSRPLRLHAEAAPATDRLASGRRCGTCAHLQRNGWGYLKCTFGWELRASRGAATDIRRWWPACVDHQTREETSGG
jgi:hypothetical protein